jgi:hypothetical protein
LKNALEKSKLNDDADVAPKVFGFAALGVMAATFALMGFPMTIIIFLALVGYFVWRAISRSEMGEIRGVFEFYLLANEILRDDERRWYGFEIQEVVNKGERIFQIMPDPPPLVRFTLGALYNYAGNLKAADEHLSFVQESDRADEKKQLAASPELKSYVRILRKLEREPAEAPQTMAAIRALERARRNRAAALLEDTRKKLKEIAAAPAPKELPQPQFVKNEPLKPLLERLAETANGATNPEIPSPPATIAPPRMFTNGSAANGAAKRQPPASVVESSDTLKLENKDEKDDAAKKRSKTRGGNKRDKEHRSITEVLRDIYD